MSEPVLQAQDLAVSYGPVQALRGCSLHVGEREAVTVIGANGAGKTTLLRALSNMVPASSGAVRFRGAELGGRATHRLARDGMLHVPEGRGVLGTLSVLENLRLAYDVRPSARSFSVALDDVFACFPRLAERRQQKAGSMSGGEQQMLALSRAIVNQPDVLLIDEPSLGLSPRMVKEAYRILRLFKERGMAILLVEQNVRVALNFAHRAYVLRQGRIVMEGESAALLSDPEVMRHYLGGPVDSAGGEAVS
ncbi:MAG: amino acid/amide transporter ATP-binding protein 2, family [Hyphomicrobiales bacterium]|nr:amino acid/amide transporter ATP-binding protein 2, family [Hyphomicrobiales bacterium]